MTLGVLGKKCKILTTNVPTAHLHACPCERGGVFDIWLGKMLASGWEIASLIVEGRLIISHTVMAGERNSYQEQRCVIA